MVHECRTVFHVQYIEQTQAIGFVDLCGLVLMILVIVMDLCVLTTIIVCIVIGSILLQTGLLGICITHSLVAVVILEFTLEWVLRRVCAVNCVLWLLNMILICGLVEIVHWLRIIVVYHFRSSIFFVQSGQYLWLCKDTSGS